MLLRNTIGAGLLRWVVGRAIPGSIHVEDLSLVWFGGQTMTDLVVQDTEGQVVLWFERVVMPDTSLWTLVAGGAA